jgi:hypothetical protein
MIELRSWLTPDGLLLSGRLLGTWGREECAGLCAFLNALPLPARCRVLLDFSALGHLHFSAAPWLIALGERLDRRGAALEIAGVNEWLQNILELGGAREARDLVERHGMRVSPLPGLADRGARIASRPSCYVSDPHGLAAACLN